MGRTVVCDIEANSLKPDKIWCIVAYDIDTKELFKFSPDSPFSGHTDWKEAFIEFAKEVDFYIGHNFISYDMYWINRILGTDIKVSQIIDTFVLSTLFRPVTPFKEQFKKLKGLDNRIGGHGLDAWGKRLGDHKISFHDYSMFTQEMLDYCIQDVMLNYKVYLALMKEKDGFSEFSIRLEHDVANMCAQQERKGFYLDQEKATELRNSTDETLAQMLEELQVLFPPIPVLIEDYTMKLKMNGDPTAAAVKKVDRYKYTEGLLAKSAGLKKELRFKLYSMQSFNPKSSKQVVERLKSIGWVPTKFTPKGNPKSDKETLAEVVDELITLNPEMDDLVAMKRYNIVADRLQKSTKWLEIVEEDNRVHGRINPIGAGTHRCSHSNDNMANIASVTTSESPISDFDTDFSSIPKFTRFDNNKIFLGLSDTQVEYALTGIEGNYGWDSRACWAASNPNNRIVGADASGIQLRALAHYMNDPDYTKKLLEEDIHVVHQLAAGLATRKQAKTFIYAWLLGAGDPKIGSLVGVEEEEYDELFAYAQNTYTSNYYSKNPLDNTLLKFTIAKMQKQGHKATKRAVALSLKGFKVKEQFLNRTPALKRLKTEEIPEVTKRGYLVGIDGRKLWIPSEHLAMSMYLQGFEAVIMKLAMRIYQEELKSKKIPFVQCAFVHDEFQVETPLECVNIVGGAITRALTEAGEILKTNCRIDGEYLVGNNWAETH